MRPSLKFGSPSLASDFWVCLLLHYPASARLELGPSPRQVVLSHASKKTAMWEITPATPEIVCGPQDCFPHRDFWPGTMGRRSAADMSAADGSLSADGS